MLWKEDEKIAIDVCLLFSFTSSRKWLFVTTIQIKMGPLSTDVAALIFVLYMFYN